MPDQTATTLSVRADARRHVEPDYALLNATLSAAADSKPDAVAELRGAQQNLIDRVARLGAVALTVESERQPLTYSFRSIRTSAEQAESDSGRWRHTGRQLAELDLAFAVRSFDLLDPLDAILTGDPAVGLHGVSWHVDRVNGAWREVRAEAITAALSKAADYATALGGSVIRIDHIADAGLLGSDAHAGGWVAAGAYAAAASRHQQGTPSLDPVPQEVTATIEARLIASVAPFADLPAAVRLAR